ncbi:hypothetical protein SARC_05025 [Sphaeroforma arctica JP610]|uniref:Mon2 C-terminal domain-containing protein n=1 Tax=Sphaeroforma arctica JP610 TaxID=667725 RepID=A0A0L0G1J7_9EUKA|nr:hypothetical protein SARC_05025 [Sphaeroforma arctica JP610]KNC82686.1 hypothetical protein SARC_05025 [Sphaeroforma arctica JP610]|eukprot:XP_014156588.1 hypothetical protein SARC_05025 [Sphaeroforma arctica JP610]
MSEVCFVLQSVGCLVDSLIDKRRKRAGSDNSLDDECAIETRQHEQALFEVLYPRLVDCIDTTDGSVRLGLKDVLKRIGSLVSICCGQ